MYIYISYTYTYPSNFWYTFENQDWVMFESITKVRQVVYIYTICICIGNWGGRYYYITIIVCSKLITHHGFFFSENNI